MPTLAEVRAQYPQYSDMSDADLSGALYNKFYSDMPREAFDAKIGMSKPDKYQQAAIDERNSLQAKGIDTGAGLTRRLAQGATFNAADEIMAGLTTPLEMIRQGTINPAEGYRYAKAREDLILEDARKKTGALGTALEIGGGIGSGLGLAQGGITAARALAPNAGLAARSAASAADSAAFGALAGGFEGNSLQERGANALQGGLIGGAVGGAVPGALSLGGAAISPVVSNLRARFNPQGFGQSQVARGVMESGMTPSQIADEVATAAREGQGMFTVADAMGNSGQRMLASTARAPGLARTDVVNFLDSRQAGQGRRVAGQLADGFDAPQTAAQTEARMTAARNTAADAEYGAVRADARPVDITNVIANIDRTVSPATAFGTGIANDSIESALMGIRGRLTDGRSNLTSFEAVQRVRGDLSDAVEAARRAGQGNKARLLGGALRELDQSLEGASTGFRQANRNFAQATRDIEAVDAGRTAAMRGRTEDTIPAYQALTPEGQAAFRAGYVDPLIGAAQGGAYGSNASRPLTSMGFIDEAAAMAPGNGMMQRQIGRENTMFQTRNAATGNSKTAENLADDAAMGAGPALGIIGQVMAGNYAGALRSTLAAGSNALTGNTPAVRQAVADILLQRGTNVTGAQFQRMIDDTIRKIEQVQLMARSMGRGAAGGLAVAGPGQNKR